MVLIDNEPYSPSTLSSIHTQKKRIQIASRLTLTEVTISSIISAMILPVPRESEMPHCPWPAATKTPPLPLPTSSSSLEPVLRPLPRLLSSIREIIGVPRAERGRKHSPSRITWRSSVLGIPGTALLSTTFPSSRTATFFNRASSSSFINLRVSSARLGKGMSGGLSPATYSSPP